MTTGKSNKWTYSLEEISQLTKLDQSTIENWEKEFYFIHAGQTVAGDKIFRKKDLDIFLRLKELMEDQDYTLAGAKRKIEEEFQIRGANPIHPKLIKKILFRIREDLKDIKNRLSD